MQSEVTNLEASVICYHAFPRNPFTRKEPSLTATEARGMIPLTQGER